MKILIVGGGITGTVLALRLLERKAAVTLIDNGKNECSAVAAGILNPLVFRRMHLSWRVDEFFPEARDFYRKYCPEAWNNLVIRRLFPSEQEKNFWLEKEQLPVFRDYMKPLDAEDENYDPENNPFGTGKIEKAAWINSETWFEQIFQRLKTENAFVKDAFDYACFHPENAVYNGESYELVIFAEGKGIKKNPWFNNLPLIPTKGELLTISSETLPEDEQLNRKCFVLPIGGKRFRVGSTYEFNTEDTSITEKNALQIRENLKSVTTSPYTVLAQQAGVRPTVPDRRPLLGKHPGYPKLAIANGMGTKGFLIAPKLMDEFASFLLEDKVFDPECDIARFVK